VIDKYVFDDSQSVKKLTIRASKGTFRWVSGISNSSAYQILTPAGSAAGAGHALLKAMQSVATDTERQPHMIHIPHNM
ncbi:hypothetical protein ACC695_40555, partial [Rhizobium ruizarguesonis]